MMPDKAAIDKPNSTDVARYRANYLAEQEGAYLYTQLAGIESDAHLAELYRRIAGIEQRHSDLWKNYLTTASQTPPTYRPNWRIRTLIWIARRLGTGAGVSLTAGSPLWKSGGRQILLGLLAAGITFGLGKLIGSAVG